MEHIFYQCPLCSHIVTEAQFRAEGPDAPCSHCGEAVMGQYQRRIMRTEGDDGDDR